MTQLLVIFFIDCKLQLQMKHSSAESHPFSKIFVTCNFLIHLL